MCANGKTESTRVARLDISSTQPNASIAFEATLPCVSITPLGCPVVPEV